MASRHQPQLFKQVKRSYEWSQEDWTNFDLKFTSHEEGVRQLDWQIELRPCSNVRYCAFVLSLLTDIDDELKVTCSFAIEDSNTGKIIFKYAQKNRFKRGESIAWSSEFTSSLIKHRLSSYKISVELCYLDALCEKSSYWDQKSVVELQENLGHLLLDPKFSDVTLVVKGNEFKAHKSMLSVRSPVFAAMFEHETKEKLENRVEIEDLEPEVVQEMLNFIYTGKSPNLTNMAVYILVAADRYELKTLFTNAEEHLISNILIENAIKLLVLADMHSATNLYNEALEFIVANVKELKATEDWKKMVENKPRLMDPIMSEVVNRLP